VSTPFERERKKALLIFFVISEDQVITFVFFSLQITVHFEDLTVLRKNNLT
jgi:hypothetical protein